MQISYLKQQMIEDKIDNMNQRVEDGEDLTQWESVLLDTLNWFLLGEDNEAPTFFY